MAKNDVRHYSTEQLECGTLKLQSFRRWQADNPPAWSYGERFALDAYAAGHSVGGRAVVEAIRRRDFADRYGRPTKTNNDYAAIIARVLLREHPQMMQAIELRPCVFDVLLPVGGGASE